MFVQNDSEYDMKLLLILGFSIFFGFVTVELGVIDWIADNWTILTIITGIIGCIAILIQYCIMTLDELDHIELSHLDSRINPAEAVYFDEI